MVLLSQPYIKDSSLTVEDLVKQVAAKIGENIKVRRFTRYTLGEGIEKNEMDFAEEVASCLLYTSPSPRDVEESRMPSSA